MQRHFFTADDIHQIFQQQNSSTLLLGPQDIITSEAEDLAERLGLRLVRELGTQAAGPGTIQPTPQAAEPLTPLKAVRGALVKLERFGSGSPDQTANTFLKDVITSADRSPMAAGYMALEKGDFPWTLTYDEIDIILEGELEIRRGSEAVHGGVGDVLFIPKGSSVVFSTPGRVRFVYVTYPADWQEK